MLALVRRKWVVAVKACFAQKSVSLSAQARLSVQAPIQAFQLAISLGLPSKVCGACYASRSHAACLVNLHTQQLLVGLLAPLAIVYIAERRFRATFLSIQTKKLS